MDASPLIIAHRGASHDAPENTLAAFRLAWEQGADAIETDLRLTADGEVVAFHDEDGRRIFGDPRRIRDLPRAEIPAPTLAEVLAETPDGGHVVLELKEPLIPPLGDFPPSRVTLIAFDAEVLIAAKRALPGVRALWLFGDYASVWRHRGQWLADRVRELGVDGVDLRFARHLHARLLAPLREDRRTVFTYTVNSARHVGRCADLELDGITTDRPADARRWLQARRASG
jgi:glycerophosphoryl diester phosphodiesterase